MPATPKKRRRLQISLRMLLLLMAVVGVALTVYRWPWVVTTREPVYDYDAQLADLPGIVAVRKLLYQSETRTTYRRNWRLEGVKNGPTEIWRDGRLWQEEHYYDGKLNGPRRVFDEQGRLVMEATYRDGLNGPFRAGDGTQWIWQGSYKQDAMQGTWQMVTAGELSAPWRAWHYLEPPRFVDIDHGWIFDDEHHLRIPIPQRSLIIIANWDQSNRHGIWSWKTRDGEILQTAEYEHDELVRWNGEPAVEQFRHWLQGVKLAAPNFVQWLESADKKWSYDEFVSPACIRINFSQGNVHESYFLFIDKIGNEIGPPYPVANCSPIPWLCEFALSNGYRFDCRYGLLWLVPSADPEPPFVDPTGVAGIEFVPGSEQAHEWNELIEVQGNEWGYTRECVEQLLKGTAIAWDCSGISDFQAALTGGSQSRLFTLRRRDALGYVLYRTGCRCELRGNTLHIVPRQRRTAEQIFLNPLGYPTMDPFG